ncbi:MAG: NAD(P)H-dependent glycerol-3-phosphate dehydrogenase [Lachnospirales bacterium]
MKISILGAGSFGLSLSVALNYNGHDVTIWSINHSDAENLKKTRTDARYLKDVVLPEEINFTSSKEEATKGMDIIVIAIPSKFVRENLIWLKDYIEDTQILVNVAKGFDEKKDKRLSEVIDELLPNIKYAVLSGPSHAEEISKKMTTTLVVASNDLKTRELVQNNFSNDFLRLYTSDDIIGVELGGALKNVIAIGVGILEGAGLGDNAKAAMMTRGNAEITKLGVKMGASVHTFSGLTGMGDLIVTCSSMHSRNRRAGIMLGEGKKLKEILPEIGMVVEGVSSAKSADNLGKKYNVETPILSAVYDIIFNEKDAKDVLVELMNRSKKDEFIV